MKFFDLFAGIGGFRLGLERAGFDCVGFCEIDKFARRTYKANFDTEGEVEWHDITEVSDEDVRPLRGKVDIITAGFPCQSFSMAGKRRGFSDTRGTLFFDIARVARVLKPRYLLLENVRGLLSHDDGDTFGIILTTLGELGYVCEWEVLNSKDFGVPQNRERVFIVGHLGGFPGRTVFPITGTSGQATKQNRRGVLIVDKQGRLKDNNTKGQYASTLTGGAHSGGNHSDMDLLVEGPGARVRHTKDGFHLARGDKKRSSIQGTHVTYPEGKSHSLCAAHVPMTLEKPAHIPGPGDVNKTVRSGGRGSLTAKHNHDHIHDGIRIRRLTPLECFRLQGFPDSHHDNAVKAGVSNSQLYKQAGNAVTVNVVEAIGKKIAEVK